MQAFHNDKKIKEKYLNRVKVHAKADEIIKGQYWQYGKGCAVGCTIHGSDHSKYETELGIPEWLARIEDFIFEGIPNERAKKWPIEFLQTIKPGQDLEKIKIPFLIFVVESVIDKFDHDKFPDVKKSIDQVLNVLKTIPINAANAVSAAADAGDASDDAAARSGYDAYAGFADTDAAAAAYAAATAYAATAAAETADAAAGYAVVYNADATVDAARYAATAAGGYARDTHADTDAADAYTKFADKILELIREY